MNLPVPLSDIPEQTRYHARQLCEVAGLRIEQCSIILNPAMPRGMSVVLGRDHWCCITGALEIHIHPTILSQYAIPAELAGVAAMVKHIKARFPTA